MNKQLLVVGVLGPRGSYTEQAALRYFGKCNIKDDYLSPQGVIESVSKLLIDYGVVPVENSIQGGVSNTIDALVRCRVNIVGEVVIPIHHVLACHPGAGKFKRVVSHEQALNQCRDYLRAEYPNCVLEPAASTSHAASNAGEDSLIVCGEHAAKTYGLKVIARSISTTNNNVTRFFVIGNEEAVPTGNDKTTLVFGLKDRPGALFDSLKVFKDEGINLTRIESRPTKKRLGDYLFIIDLEGHRGDEVVRQALESLIDSTTFIKVLGSYPKNFKNGKEVSDTQ
jgi:chorismate mutase/prephenate dehydratase